MKIVIGSSRNHIITAENLLQPEFFPFMALPMNPIEEELAAIQTEPDPSRVLLPALDASVVGT